MIERGFYYNTEQLVAIGQGRIREKALALRPEDIKQYVMTVHKIGEDYNLDLSDFTNKLAFKAWKEGRCQWGMAKNVVNQWDFNDETIDRVN